jgi:hypothetical protein
MSVLHSNPREAFEKQVAALEDRVQTLEALLRDERAARRAAELTIQELVLSSPTPHSSRPQSRASPRNSSHSHTNFASPPSISQHSTIPAQHETDHDPYCTPPASPPHTRVIHAPVPSSPSRTAEHIQAEAQASSPSTTPKRKVAPPLCNLPLPLLCVVELICLLSASTKHIARQ